MPFSDEIIREAWARSGGRCECRHDGHGHGVPCGAALLWTMRWAVSASGGWEACRRTSWGTDTLVNAEIRCASCQRPQVVWVK